MDSMAKEIIGNEPISMALPLRMSTVPPRTLAYPRYAKEQHQHRESTIVAYYEAVTCAINMMYARFGEPLNLNDMADSAALSPHHFNRIFRHITGITPGHFLCAIRMRAARRMLLVTGESVTDICFAVGYNSLGSFISRFTGLVGLSPTQLRELAEQDIACALRTMDQGDAVRGVVPRALPGEVDGALTGSGIGPGIRSGIHFVGLFPTPIPQGSPLACTWFTSGSRFVLRSPSGKALPVGRYYALAASFPHAHTSLDYLLPDPEAIKIGAAPYPVLIGPGQPVESLSISLRALRFTDPPLLLAIPALLK